MSEWVLATEESGFARHFAAAALPVTIGGDAGCDIVLAQVEGSVQIGQLDDVFFVQPGRATGNVRLDGEPLRGSRRLADGSQIALDTARLNCRISAGRLTLAIEAQVTAGDTAPPDFQSLAQDKTREVTVSPISFTPNVQSSGTGKGPKLSKAALSIYLAFVVLAALGWFAFTAKSVRFELAPVADEISLPGTLFKFRLGDRFLLRSGEHRLRAELAGYYPIDEAIRVGTMADQTVALDFVRLPGLISLGTEPEVGAEVRLDGEPIGQTPLVDYEIVPGTHQLQFTAERYLSEVVTLDVEGGHERQSLSPTLTPSWAPVSFSSAPSGAVISIDGREMGTTPAVLELTAGNRSVELQLPRYNPWRRDIRVVANEPQTVPEARLSPENGRLSLTTSPSDASVIVNGEFVGRTPRELTLPPNVGHSVTIQKPGYETEVLERNFDPGEHESLALTLDPRIGVIEVTSSPAGAEVFINGEPAGTTPATFELIAIDQAISLRLDGYADEEQVITPRPGYRQSLPFELVALNQATGGGYASAITTGFGTRLRLIPAGRFTMGSSRSEEGRRLNEFLRDVEITRAFYLAETEMTNAQYRRCVPDHDSGSFEGHSLNEDDQPVVNVDVQEIFACLNRLSIEAGLQPVYQEDNGVLAPVRPLRNGYRLPTEAEFAWALRAAGRDGAAPLRYSWGDEPPPPDRFDNLADLSASDIVQPAMITYRDGAVVSAPVGSFTANAVGLYDMGGNVSEWVQDFYDATAVASEELQVDPLGPVTGQLNIVRGPSWMSATVRQLRLSFRDFEDSGRVDLGFRIARNIE